MSNGYFNQQPMGIDFQPGASFFHRPSSTIFIIWRWQPLAKIQHLACIKTFKDFKWNIFLNMLTRTWKAHDWSIMWLITFSCGHISPNGIYTLTHTHIQTLTLTFWLKDHLNQEMWSDLDNQVLKSSQSDDECILIIFKHIPFCR